MLLSVKPTAVVDPVAALKGRPDPLPTAETHFVNGHALKGPFPEGVRLAQFAMGCFWGVERLGDRRRLCRRLYAQPDL